MTRPASPFAPADQPDVRKSLRWVVGALVVAILVGLGAVLWSARPHDARPDAQLRGTLQPVPSWLDEPIRAEGELASLEQPVGGRP